jgi:hypothetical protein
MPLLGSRTAQPFCKSSGEASVGPKRKDSLGLPNRFYLRSGSFYYAHPGGKWENLGKDLAAAKKRAEHYADPTDTYGTMSWYLDQFIIDCEQRVEEAVAAHA